MGGLISLLLRLWFGLFEGLTKDSQPHRLKGLEDRVESPTQKPSQ